MNIVRAHGLVGLEFLEGVVELVGLDRAVNMVVHIIRVFGMSIVLEGKGNGGFGGCIVVEDTVFVMKVPFVNVVIMVNMVLGDVGGLGWVSIVVV